jgi:hypothetical protein
MITELSAGLIKSVGWDGKTHLNSMLFIQKCAWRIIASTFAESGYHSAIDFT